MKPLILTCGDPAGIGPEITAKAWNALKNSPEYSFAVLGPISAYGDLCPVQEISDISEAVETFASALPVLNSDAKVKINPGHPDPRNADLITGAIEQAVSACLSGHATAMITNPIAKSVLYEAGFRHPGHTEFLGVLSEQAPVPYERGPLMMLANDELRVALVTVHQSVKDAAQSVTVEKIRRHAKILHGALKHDLGLSHPLIAMAALNPHAGEDGSMGREEIEILNPAAESLRSEGIDITNALPPDTMFHAEARARYDAAMCMYHDQGLIPVKTIDFHGTVNITMGLPIIRTSPDHGTAFDIAGKGVARPDSLIAAIKMARAMATHRQSHG